MSEFPHAKYQISSKYFRASFTVYRGRIVESSPGMRHTIGRPWHRVRRQFYTIGHKVALISLEYKGAMA
jgi:hypothetical protein